MPIRALAAHSGGGDTFDYRVRSITTALLACSIVAVTLYSLLTQSKPNELLIGWTGIVVGVYFGYHAGKNGASLPPPITEATPIEIPTHEDQA